MLLTFDVKAEICETAIPGELYATFCRGVLYGLREGKQFLTTDRVFVRDKLLETFGGAARSETRKKGDKPIYRIFFLKDESAAGLDKNVLLGGDDTSTGIFLRGLFLSCGTVSVQKVGYHLELSLYTEEKCEVLNRMINEHGMMIKRSSRRGIPFLYTKNSENIADFLTFLGAGGSAMEIMNIKIYKDFRSGINRVVNCETANLEKTASASADRIGEIRRIEEKMGLDALSPELRELAWLRLAYPDVSLSELGKMLDPPLSKSGVNHRLERLKKTAEGLKD
ncbi:MAG: DNA-binding protein WhiA [Bacteroides sp.]|nr:DNA-binding protein WhiA [Eubacterium sp.]MCM1417181.1 DNA-binding protein WhiA [Roseburia sp.]MCM1461198.1 DNA-binding protein WhiA [Bacteroides sp.]